VLSGGLGGSPYVKTQLEQKYSSTNITIIRSQEPKLSVVKGLVMDRKQRLVSGRAALKTRIARASYGVLCRQLYNPNIHVNADVEYDFYIKKQKWAINQIDWLIKKVDHTSAPPTSHERGQLTTNRAIQSTQTPHGKRHSRKRSM